MDIKLDDSILESGIDFRLLKKGDVFINRVSNHIHLVVGIGACKEELMLVNLTENEVYDIHTISKNIYRTHCEYVNYKFIATCKLKIKI